MGIPHSPENIIHFFVAAASAARVRRMKQDCIQATTSPFFFIFFIGLGWVRRAGAVAFQIDWLTEDASRAVVSYWSVIGRAALSPVAQLMPTTCGSRKETSKQNDEELCLAEPDHAIPPPVSGCARSKRKALAAASHTHLTRFQMRWRM